MASLDAYLNPPEDAPSEECLFCEGTGAIIDDNGNEDACEACGGDGFIELVECSSCHRLHCSCDDDYDAWVEDQL